MKKIKLSDLYKMQFHALKKHEQFLVTTNEFDSINIDGIEMKIIKNDFHMAARGALFAAVTIFTPFMGDAFPCIHRRTV